MTQMCTTIYNMSYKFKWFKIKFLLFLHTQINKQCVKRNIYLN